MEYKQTMAFDGFSGLLDVSAGMYPRLGIMTVSWDISGADPLSGFELSIQQNGVDVSGDYRFDLSGGARSKVIEGLPNGDYTAIILSKTLIHNGTTVPSVMAPFTVARATEVGLSASCDDDGNVTVTFERVKGFEGKYFIVANGKEEEASNADADASSGIVSVLFSFADLGWLEMRRSVKLSATIDSNPLEESVNVSVEHRAVITSFTVTQVESTFQHLQGKATVAYSLVYQDSATTFDLYDSSDLIVPSCNASGVIIDLLAGDHDFSLRVNAASAAGSRDLNTAPFLRTEAIRKDATFDGWAAVAKASGNIVITSPNVHATSSDYEYVIQEVDGAGNNTENSVASEGLLVNRSAIIARPDGHYKIFLKVWNNGAFLVSAPQTVEIAKTRVIKEGSLEADLKKYACFQTLDLLWTHVKTDADCEYVATLYNVSSGARVLVDTASKSVAGGSAVGESFQSLELSVLEPAQYIARLTVTINGNDYWDEIAINVENIPFTMELSASAVNMTADEGATNPHMLTFSRAAGLPGSLFDYAWTLKKGLVEVSGGVVSLAGSAAAASSANLYALPLDKGARYTLSVSTNLYGNPVNNEKSFSVLNLEAAALNNSQDSNLTNPYILSFSCATGSLPTALSYSWALTRVGASGSVASGTASAAGILPYSESLTRGAVYKLRVSTVLDGVTIAAEKLINVPGIHRKPVIVDLGVAIDASANAAVLDAAAPELLGEVVYCNTALPAVALYHDSSHGLIEFWEPSGAIGTIDAQFTVNASGEEVPGIYEGLSHAKNLVLGLHDCLQGGLDCSEATPFDRMNNRAYDQYATIGDMTLGYIADKLFGHPAATAAITNDVHIKETMNASPGADASAIELGHDVSGAEVNSPLEAGDQKLALRLVQTMLFAASDGDNSPAVRAARIANSVIGQDADRARDEDNNKLAPEDSMALPFYAGDVLFFKLTLKSLSVFEGPYRKGGDGGPILAALKARLVDQSYVFRITLA